MIFQAERCTFCLTKTLQAAARHASEQVKSELRFFFSHFYLDQNQSIPKVCEEGVRKLSQHKMAAAAAADHITWKEPNRSLLDETLTYCRRRYSFTEQRAAVSWKVKAFSVHLPSVTIIFWRIKIIHVTLLYLSSSPSAANSIRSAFVRLFTKRRATGPGVCVRHTAVYLCSACVYVSEK